MKKNTLPILLATMLVMLFALQVGAGATNTDSDRDVAVKLELKKASADRPEGDIRTQSSTYTAQATSSACFADPTGDVVNTSTGGTESYPKADLNQWCADFLPDNKINLSHRNEVGTDPANDPNWLYGLTGLLWDVDVNGDHVGEYGVYYFNTGYGVVVEIERYSDGAIVCEGTPDFDGMYYDALFNTSCIGNATKIWTDAFMMYDSNYNDQYAPIYADIADTFGGPVEQTSSTPPADDTNTQPAPDSGASKYFADVTGGPHVANIDFLYEQGLVKGCATNPLRYCPNNPLTRAQYATVMAEFIRNQQ